MDDQPNALMKRGPDDKAWYVVAYATGMTEAEIVAGLLRSANIPVFLFREAGGTVIPVSFGLLGEIQVAVPEAYYAEAAVLLDSSADDSYDELPPGTGEPDEDL